MFRNRLLISVVSGHFAVDTLNSLSPVLLATLAVPLGLMNAQIGLALTFSTLAAALSQPIFGLLADRFPGRPTILSGIGLLWMALCMMAITQTHDWLLLTILLTLGALGSGLFHPIGTAMATAAEPTRAGRATAIFFFGGQAGLSVGPLLGGLLLSRGDTTTLLPLCVAALIPVLLMVFAPRAEAQLKRARQSVSKRDIALFAIVAFVALVTVRSSIQSAYMAFLPKLFADRGWEPALYGAIAGTFMMAAAVGNIVTGDIADRYGMRAATVWPLVLSVPAGLLCLWTPTPLIAFVTCALAGFLISGQHSVLVVYAQQLLPVRQGFAAGLILGFTFATGALGTWLAGVLADVITLEVTMQIVTVMGIPAALLALTLPGRAVEPLPAPVPAER